MKKEKTHSKESKNVSCNDSKCTIHGNLKTRGRSFRGYVKKKFLKRIVIEFERVVYVKKYERYSKLKTKLHARLPDCAAESVNVGDYVEVMECRPLSKIIHFVFVRRIK